jgi:hypothetical protein
VQEHPVQRQVDYRINPFDNFTDDEATAILFNNYMHYMRGNQNNQEAMLNAYRALKQHIEGTFL